MMLDYEALRHAQNALSIFDGIEDTFGGQMYSDVASGIIAELSRNQNGRENCCGIMADLASSLQNSKEMMSS